MFLLVEFIDKKELAVIPDNWLEGTSCAVWPPYISTSRLVKAVTDKEPPLDSWRAYVIRVMYKHESYERARSKLAEAELHSDLQTEPEISNVNNGRPARIRRSPDRLGGSSSDAEDELPPGEELPRAYKRKKRTMSKTSNKSQGRPAVTEANPNLLPLPTPPVRLEISTTRPTSTVATSSLPVNTTVVPAVLNSPIIQTRTTTALNSPIIQTRTTTALNSPIIQTRTTTALNSPIIQTRTTTALNSPIIQTRTTTALNSPIIQTRTTTALNSPINSSTPRAARGSVISVRDLQYFTLLEKIRQEQKEQTKMLGAILEKLGGLSVDDGVPDDITFPINDLAELNAFEERLKTDKNLEKLVIGHLTSIGGSSIENMGSRILKYIVANPLAESFNWSGTKGKRAFDKLMKGKRAFDKLMIPSILKRAIKRSYREVTDANVTSVCRIFLKSARDRDGGRKRRMKPSGVVVRPVPNEEIGDIAASSDTELGSD